MGAHVMLVKTVKNSILSVSWCRLTERVRRGLLDRKNRRNRKCPQSVWVHIGPHKTGTTLLQNQLLENPEKLRPYSVGYDGESYWMGVRLASNSPLEPAELTSLREKWQAQIQRRSESVVILSSEGFIGSQSCPWTNSAAVARDLKAILDGFEVRIVFCKRRLHSLYESLYHQFIKEGGTLSIGDFLVAYPPEKFEWDKILAGYVDCFGSEAIRVIDFEKAMSDPGRYVEYAFGDFGVPLRFRVAEGHPENPSYNETGLRLALLCNPHLDKDEKLKLRGFLQTHFCKQPGQRFSVLSDTELNRLRDLDKMTDVRLHEEFWVD